MLFNNISGEQIRAARAIVRIDQVELARLTRLSLETIKRLEGIRGPVQANLSTLRAIEDAFRRIGVTFKSSDDFTGVWWVGPANDPKPDDGGLAYLRDGRGHPLHRLTFASTAVPASDRDLESVLNDIARRSAHRNAALGVTGALVACDGHFLQAMEGSREAVLQIYGGICTDPRHRDLFVAESSPIGARRFADWRVCARALRSDDSAFDGQAALIRGLQPRTLSAPVILDLLDVVMAAPPGRQEALRA